MKARDSTRNATQARMSPAMLTGESAPPNLKPKRVNVDFPAPAVEALDREARRPGVTRQALVKLWIAERLERAA
jgi:hypothetical protein